MNHPPNPSKRPQYRSLPDQLADWDATLSLHTKAADGLTAMLTGPEHTVPWFRRRRAAEERLTDVAARVATLRRLEEQLRAVPRSEIAHALVLNELTSAITSSAWWKGVLHNEFHPRVLEHLDQIVDATHEALATYTLEDLPVTEHLDTKDLFSRGQIRSTAIVQVQRRQMLINPPGVPEEEQYNHVHDHTDGRRWIILEHYTSGQRIRCTESSTPGIWTIHAKSYEVPAISNTAPHDLGDLVYGLGLGARIYQEAARLVPEARWARSSVIQLSSAGVRRKLHREDPYRWQSPDCTCSDQWASLTPETSAAFNHQGR